MIIDTQLETDRFGPLLRDFIAITRWAPWQKRIRALEQQYAENKFSTEFVTSHHWIELEMARHRKVMQISRRLPDPWDQPSTYRFQAFVAVAAQVFARLGQNARKRLKGMLLDGLQSDYGLMRIIHEMEIAARLMDRDCDVYFSDLERGGGFDFLALREGCEMEVECKAITADIGRQIHQREFLALGKRLHRTMDDCLDQGESICFVRVFLPGRLYSRQQYQESVADCVSTAISESRNYEGPQPCSVSVEKVDMSEIRIPNGAQMETATMIVRSFVARRTGGPNRNIMFGYRPERAAVVIVLESSKPDKVLDGIYRQLKDSGSSQFTKRRPGYLCVRLLDVNSAQLLNIFEAQDDNSGRGPGLQIMSNALLARRPHIHSISFNVPGEVELNDTLYNDVVNKSVQERGYYLQFTNPQHPLSENEKYNIFSSEIDTSDQK